jgi:hypothetical protein
MERIKAILRDPREVDFYARWFVRFVLLVLVVKVAFFNQVKTVTEFRTNSPARDSLIIEQAKVRILEETLIKQRTDATNDSLALRVAKLDSLLGYIAAAPGNP